MKKDPHTAPRSTSWYGRRPDRPDKRDYYYRDIRKRIVLPARVDLRAHCSRIESQGRLGSCTAHALVGALEFLERKSKMPFAHLSRLFVYYNERVIEHAVHWDNGAEIRNGIKSLAKQGVCLEARWPYIQKRFNVRPGPPLYQEAKTHRITSYHRVQTHKEMRQCLAEGFPFVFGFTVYDGFESYEVEKTGRLNVPTIHEKVVGDHAVMAVGYDDKQERFLVRNSWGDDWGMKGYFTIPYEYVEDHNLAGDFWTIRRGEHL
jgi:C1A family cysteine protease